MSPVEKTSNRLNKILMQLQRQENVAPRQGKKETNRTGTSRWKDEKNVFTLLTLTRMPTPVKVMPAITPNGHLDRLAYSKQLV